MKSLVLLLILVSGIQASAQENCTLTSTNTGGEAKRFKIEGAAAQKIYDQMSELPAKTIKPAPGVMGASNKDVKSKNGLSCSKRTRMSPPFNEIYDCEFLLAADGTILQPIGPGGVNPQSERKSSGASH